MEELQECLKLNGSTVTLCRVLEGIAKTGIYPPGIDNATKLWRLQFATWCDRLTFDYELTRSLLGKIYEKLEDPAEAAALCCALTHLEEGTWSPSNSELE